MRAVILLVNWRGSSVIRRFSGSSGAPFATDPGLAWSDVRLALRSTSINCAAEATCSAVKCV